MKQQDREREKKKNTNREHTNLSSETSVLFYYFQLPTQTFIPVHYLLPVFVSEYFIVS